jgi:hypothetical protein
MLGSPGESGICGFSYQVPIVHEIVSWGILRSDALKFVREGPMNNARYGMKANLGGNMAEWVA